MKKPASQIPETESDPALDHLLSSWKVKVDLGPNFRAAVWQRIATASKSSLSARLWRWVESRAWILARPAVATAVIVATVFTGLWFGSLGPHDHADGKSAYVRSVSPFASSHSDQQ